MFCVLSKNLICIGFGPVMILIALVVVRSMTPVNRHDCLSTLLIIYSFSSHLVVRSEQLLQLEESTK